MKIGIFGGSFNPIHIGHLITIEEVKQKLKLDKVLFIPTYKPPHKNPQVSYEHRRNMVALAIKYNPSFELCEIEKELGGISWTIETLKALHKHYQNDKLYLILGSDQYCLLNTWKQPQDLVKYAKLVIMPRPDVVGRMRKSKNTIIVNVSQISIASKNLRNDIKHGKSIRYKVVDKVYDYIKKHKLYLA